MSTSDLGVRALFDLGRTLATPGAIRAADDCCENNSGWLFRQFLQRHVSGDWGDCCADDKQLNDESVKDGSRILSVYRFNGTKFWVITEAADDNGHRAATTILLPEEY